MSDRVTYCDVCECAECPKYGDDCDGDKRSDDLISREDAIVFINSGISLDTDADREYATDMLRAIPSAEPSLKAIKRQIDEHWYLDPPSAEAEPTVIRSRAFMPTKDFKEWAKRIRETNPNAVVIPCDAEVVSAEAVQGWIPCSERLPEVACRCLVTLSNNVVAVGTLHSEGEYEDDFGYIVSWGKRWHLEPASMMIAYPEDSVVAWMPLPEPYKGGGSE